MMPSPEFSHEQFTASVRPIVDARRELIIGEAIDANHPGSITLDYAEFEAWRQIREELRELAGANLEGAWNA